MKIKPPKFIRRLMPDLIWEIEDENGVFLTFDDGPTPGVTEWILSTLKRYNAKATFFVLGKNVEMYPDLYQKILAGILCSMLFLSAVLMARKKWFGCIPGILVGIIVIWISFQSTGQVIDIERPLGIALIAFYIFCGYGSDKR